jgi:membrane-bound lytic murein transglycosylase B
MAKSRAKSDASYEGRLLLAINAINSKQITKIREAARLYDVSRTTIQDRLKGIQPAPQLGILRRKFTPTEEEIMRNWILSLERRGVPPRPCMLAQIANLLLAERDATQIPKKIGVN